jgi:hypothetical protein
MQNTVLISNSDTSYKMNDNDYHDDEMNKNKMIDLYIQSLNEKDLKAYLIAKSHLGSTFAVEKSVGFLKWKQNNTSLFG